MLHQCVAILGPLCLNHDAQIELQSNSLWALAHVTMDGARITSMIRTDSPLRPDRRTMPRHCVGENCIHYHVYCTSEGGGYFCRVSYAEPQDDYSRRIEISAADPEQMAVVFTRLRVRGFSSGSLYRLSALTERSPNPYPPHCRRDHDPGCT